MYSLHKNSLNVCVPLVNDLPTTKEELEDMVALETVLDEKHSAKEQPITPHIQHNNTLVLQDMIERYDRLYQEYFTTTATRFEETHFNIPIGERP